MDGLTEGRIVHYVFDENTHRPAIVVNAWKHVEAYRETGEANLLVFLDGDNDDPLSGYGQLAAVWRTSVRYSEAKEPGTWHWIEKA